MSRDDELLAAGPSAILEAASSGRETRANWSILAMTAARESRRVELADEVALDWAEAAIQCYAIEASQIQCKVTRQGRELPMHGCRLRAIERFGSKSGHSVLDPQPIIDWIRELSALFDSAADYHVAKTSFVPSDPASERAMLLRERLGLGSWLVRLELAPSWIYGWLTPNDQQKPG